MRQHAARFSVKGVTTNHSRHFPPTPRSTIFPCIFNFHKSHELVFQASFTRAISCPHAFVVDSRIFLEKVSKKNGEQYTSLPRPYEHPLDARVYRTNDVYFPQFSGETLPHNSVKTYPYPDPDPSRSKVVCLRDRNAHSPHPPTFPLRHRVGKNK